METKWTVLFGTRPEAIKLRPVVRELEKANIGAVDVVFSGQHGERMVKELPHARSLAAAVMGETLPQAVGTLMRKIGEDLSLHKPDCLLVQGDTATAYAGAAAGFLSGIMVAHIEAGLRTYDLENPFPEEFFRQEIAKTASLHFAPTVRAMENLVREGVPREKVYLVGNTGIDALFSLPKKVWGKREKPKTPTVLLTVHRRENLGEPLLRIFAAVKEIAARHPEAAIFFPCHPNPLIEEAAKALEKIPNLSVLPPLGYTSFVRLLCRCSLVITDSGGVEEEAAALGIPTVVLRRKTERSEGVETGVLHLAGDDTKNVIAEAEEMLSKGRFPLSCAFGDGKAAERIVAVLKQVKTVNSP